MAIGKRKRFDIFKRDSFTCKYCGGKPPNVVLQIDHIHPVSNGGGDDRDNLITACFDCNSGKSDRLLNDSCPSVEVRQQAIKDAKDQYRAMQRWKKSIRKMEDSDIDCVEEVFIECWSSELRKPARESVRLFMRRGLDVDDMLPFAYLASERCQNPQNAFKYFCGCCWKRIKETEDAKSTTEF